jgi:hypothetical protein
VTEKLNTGRLATYPTTRHFGFQMALPIAYTHNTQCTQFLSHTLRAGCGVLWCSLFGVARGRRGVRRALSSVRVSCGRGGVDDDGDECSAGGQRDQRASERSAGERHVRSAGERRVRSASERAAGGFDCGACDQRAASSVAKTRCLENTCARCATHSPLVRGRYCEIFTFAPSRKSKVKSDQLASKKIHSGSGKGPLGVV